MVKRVSTEFLPGEAMGPDCFGWSGAAQERTEEAEDQVFQAWLEKRTKEKKTKDVKKEVATGLRVGKRLL